MQVALIVEDRDSLILFINAAEAPAEAVARNLSIDNVNFYDLENEDVALWLESNDSLYVIEREKFDFENDPMTERWPIPTPQIVFNEAEYKRILAE